MIRTEPSAVATAPTPVARPRSAQWRWLRWWRAPIWLFALLTGAKSFADNPILGSRRLNRAGLHVWRLRAAHALAGRRRARLAKGLSAGLRGQFDRDGFLVIPDFMPEDAFRHLRAAIFDMELECREQVQGDAITRRVPIGRELLQAAPQLTRLLDSPRWRGVMSYIATSRSQPLYYLQTIFGGIDGDSSDPQEQLHADTFHPSLKAWLFLTDVSDDGRPLTYVAGSHRLSPERVAWEHKKSVEVRDRGDRLSQRGSLRVRPEELPGLNLPPPARFAVPANTLVAIDTCGFHARAVSDRPTVRVELWAYCRRSPFLPWAGGDPLSWPPIANRRAEWLAAIVDWLDRRGWMMQHWRRAGRRRVTER